MLIQMKKEPSSPAVTDQLYVGLIRQPTIISRYLYVAKVLMCFKGVSLGNPPWGTFGVAGDHLLLQEPAQKMTWGKCFCGKIPQGELKNGHGGT